jgi:hypothetical protein
LAYEKKDAAFCAEVKDAVWKTRCQDKLAYDAATEAGNLAGCAAISDAVTKTSCRSSIGATLSQEDCLKTDLGKDFCERADLRAQAVAKQDPAICQPLAGTDFFYECTDSVTDDPDFDGLDGGQEARYGTDPRNADTDGDGFKDGDEVKGGYDPNGAGKL